MKKIYNVREDEIIGEYDEDTGASTYYDEDYEEDVVLFDKDDDDGHSERKVTIKFTAKKLYEAWSARTSEERYMDALEDAIRHDYGDVYWEIAS